jgi:hypothetical protein
LASVLSAGLILPPAALAGNPYEDLFGRKPQMWTDPEGRFAIDLPVGWEAKYKEGEPHVAFVRFDPDQGLSAQVTVELRPLPPKTRLNHFVLRVQEETKKQAPGYTIVDQDKVSLSGNEARRTLFTYQVRGNAQLTNEVVQVLMVQSDRGFVITLETVLGGRARFWEEFELMTKGFSPHAIAGASGERSGARKKIRSGELVNPDALKY